MEQPTVGVVDVPIRHSDHDALGLSRYAEALGQFILVCDTPMTVGIQGDWGAGKTSLMNLIEGWLAAQTVKPPPPTLMLNTWQYAQLAAGDTLALVVLRALHEKVAGADQGLAKVWGRLAKAFDRVKGFQVAGVGVETKDDTTLPDLAELKSTFAAIVAARLQEAGAGHDRLVVFIDDLDRILPERAVEILEALKNFVDVPGCIFVLACDYAVVTKGLKKKFNVGEEDLGGRSFFDKIIQVPFRMPVYRYDVERYVRAMLGHIGWRIWKNDVGAYQRLLEHSVGFNPRGLKRMCIPRGERSPADTPVRARLHGVRSRGALRPARERESGDRRRCARIRARRRRRSRIDSVKRAAAYELTKRSRRSLRSWQI